MKRNYRLKDIFLLVLVGILALNYSCKRNGDIAHDGVEGNGVRINLIDDDFDSNAISLKGSTEKKTEINNNNSGIVSLQKMSSGPFEITAELALDGLSTAIKASNSNKINKMADKLGGVGKPIKYVVVVYKPDGTYLGQEVGDASNPDQKMFASLNLPANQHYTFVTYSLGATTAPPMAPTTNLNVATVGFGVFTGDVNGSDLMFAINENVLLTAGNTALDVHLKHQFSKITISIDDSDASGIYGQPSYTKGGYPLVSETTLEGARGTIANFYSGCSIRFKNGTVFGKITGSSPSSITFGGIKAAAGNEKIMIINTGAEAAYKGSITFAAGEIQIGKDKNVAPVSINIDGTAGYGLQPGKAYTLKLKFNSDRYALSNGNSAVNGSYVFIAGYGWDRYNVGVTDRNPGTNNPDVPTAQNQGAKYQWGFPTGTLNRYISQANDITNGNTPYWIEDVTPGGFDPVSPANAWNLGTADNPIKNTVKDPCQSGYRVNSTAEIARLIKFSSQSNIGTWLSDWNIGDSNNNFTAGKVFTSKKSLDIKVTFPIAGTRDTKAAYRSYVGNYWTLNPYVENGRQSSSSQYLELSNSMSRFYGMANDPYGGDVMREQTVGMSVRCIKE